MKLFCTNLVFTYHFLHTLLSGSYMVLEHSKSSYKVVPKTILHSVAHPKATSGLTPPTLFTPPSILCNHPTLSSPLPMSLVLPTTPSTPTLPNRLNINSHFMHPLTDANFLIWKFIFNTIVLIHKFCHVNENEAPIETLLFGNINPKVNKWYITDQLVMLCILSTISPSVCRNKFL